MKKNIAIVSILIIAAALTYIITKSYAYPSTNKDTKPVFVSTETQTIAVTNNDYYNDSLNVSLTIGDNNKKTCRYDVVWVWDETLNVLNQYQNEEEKEDEFVVSGSNGIDSFTDTQVYKYENDNYETVLYSSKIEAENNHITTQTWNFEVKFNKEIDHEYTYSGRIKINNVICE